MTLNGNARTAPLPAREAVGKSGEVVELLERALTLAAEDDPVQPAIHHIYAALCEAETRRDALEDWYTRTYGGVIEEMSNSF